MAQILYKIFDYVIRRFNAPSAGLKKATEPSLRHRLARSPDSIETPSHLKRGGRSKRLVRIGSSFRTDLEQSIQLENRLMKFVTLRKSALIERVELHRPLIQKEGTL
jgi:hypothetical protein